MTKIMGACILLLLLVACGSNAAAPEPTAAASAAFPDPIELIPGEIADYYSLRAIGGSDGRPGMVELVLEGGISAELEPPAPVIRIYPVARSAELAERAAALADSPLDAIPQDAFAVQALALGFGSGEGVRFVGRVLPAAAPVSNADLRYLYYGVSADGRYVVEADLPVMTDALVASDSAEAQTAAFLSSLLPGDWTPPLGELDRMIGSLTLGERADSGLPFDASPGAVTGGVWQWWALEGSDDTVQVVQNPADYTLELARDGTFVGRADCNAVAGSWSADDAGLRLGEVAATLSVCDGGSWSEVYVQGLESVTGGGVSAEGELLLTLADGRMLRFQLAAP